MWALCRGSIHLRNRVLSLGAARCTGEPEIMMRFDNCTNRIFGTQERTIKKVRGKVPEKQVEGPEVTQSEIRSIMFVHENKKLIIKPPELAECLQSSKHIEIKLSEWLEPSAETRKPPPESQ